VIQWSKQTDERREAGTVECWCLHGAVGMAADWRGFAKHLAAAKTGSRAVDLWRFLEGGPLPLADFGRALNADAGGEGSRGIGRALLGYSMGGRLALHALLEKHPPWQAAIIVSAHPGLEAEAEREARRMADAAWANQALTNNWQEFLAAWDAQPILNISAPRDPQNPARNVARRREIARSFIDWSLGTQQPLWDRLPEITLPVLWVVGANDAKFLALAERAVARMARATLAVAPDAGHRVPWDAPEWLAGQVAQFLRKTLVTLVVILHLCIIPLLVMGCATPARANLTERALRDAADYSASRRGCSLLVVQHGRTLLEEYPNGGGTRMSHQIYSGTKAFFTLAALVAAQEGLLHPDEPVANTIPEWRGDARRSKITLRELMNFTDGLDPAFHLHSDKVIDRNTLALRTPAVAPRGTAFTYGPSHGQVLCEVLRRKLASRRETPFDYLHHKVLDPLGIDAVPHRADAQGMPLVASGFRLTARQWSRFGLLLLGRGTYGRRVIVQEQWFAQCFAGTRVNPMFGLGFWMNHDAANKSARETDIENLLEKKWQEQDWHGRCICRSAPADLVAVVGSGYQRLFVIPSLDLVIVRQGTNARFSDAEFLRKILRQ
jgi:2-succinyl-6-hydroxy-2,4-cyclohexadiene-1-carboxylate synthase